jgi:hypothetical protein
MRPTSTPSPPPRRGGRRGGELLKDKKELFFLRVEVVIWRRGRKKRTGEDERFCVLIS